MLRFVRFPASALLLIFALTVGLPGCAHYFTHPTKPPAAFKADQRECERVAERQVARRGSGRVCDEVERCLISKGWRRN